MVDAFCRDVAHVHTAWMIGEQILGVLDAAYWTGSFRLPLWARINRPDPIVNLCRLMVLGPFETKAGVRSFIHWN